jgi:hypothetical protein
LGQKCEKQKPSMSLMLLNDILWDRFAVIQTFKRFSLEIKTINDLFICDLRREHIEHLHHEETLVNVSQVFAFICGLEIFIEHLCSMPVLGATIFPTEIDGPEGLSIVVNVYED